MLNQSTIINEKSNIFYDYTTIKITQSRIDKGLIALPKSVYDWFPKYNTDIKILLNDSPILRLKNYSSYESSTRESRIGGMREWFRENNIKEGDEIVIQVIDKQNHIYRIIPEKIFITKLKEFQKNFDDSTDDEEAEVRIKSVATWTGELKSKVIISEFLRLLDKVKVQDRIARSRELSKTRERASASIRYILGEIYKGHCQVCDFWFLKKNDKSYFEIHHINPIRGDDLKNILVVCANCHRQFEFADSKLFFNPEEWLIAVKFNEKLSVVDQFYLRIDIKEFYKHIHIIC